jgi:hypothetical protein
MKIEYMTDEQMRDLVKECGLDWHRGYMPLFDGDPTNRYAVLIEAVIDRCARQRHPARDAMTTPRTSTPTLIAAMRALARDIDSPDGVANAAILEAADRMEEMLDALVAADKYLDAAADAYEAEYNKAHGVEEQRERP